MFNIKKYICLILVLLSQAVQALESKEYAIVLIPEENCSEIVRGLNDDASKKLSSYGNYDDVPHIKLYEASFQPSDIDAIFKSFNQIAIPNITYLFSTIVDNNDLTIDFNIMKDRRIEEFHQLILFLTYRLHVRKIKRMQDRYDSLTDIQKQQVDEYGTYGLLDQYQPKITVYYLQSPNKILNDVANQLSTKTSDNVLCKATKLAIAELDYVGNITSIIKEKDITSQN